MRKSQKWQVACVLSFMAFCAIDARAAGNSPKEELAFTVYVHNYARVDAKTLANAEQVATGIFSKAGVVTRWIDAPQVSDGSSLDLAESESNTLTHLRVYILPQEMAQRLGMPDDVMGLAPGRGPDRLLVYVFHQWLNQVAQKQIREQGRGNITWHASVSQILGAMMAHELGHILLNLPSHSETGIMRGDWDRKQLSDAAFGFLLFTRQQTQVIQADVARRNRQQTSAAESVHLAFNF